MSLLIYLVVALVAVFGVLFEMNVLVEPPAKIGPAVATASRPAQPQAAMPAVGAPVAPPAEATSRAPSNQIAIQQAPATAASNKCDVTVCAAAYRTFRASDCTYEPRTGERELCTKGVVSDQAAAEAALNAHADASANAAVSGKCNVSLCAQAYVSFTPADCTYQPLEGPRRLCSK